MTSDPTGSKRWVKFLVAPARTGMGLFDSDDRQHGMAWLATRDGMSSYPRNPNLCERCIGAKRPERGFLLADTGRCGKCGEIAEVWDLEHLSELAAQGRAVYAPDGFTRIERPIRDSHARDSK